MKGIIILIADENQKFNKINDFNGKSGEELTLQWSKNLISEKVVEGLQDYKIVTPSNLTDLLCQISEICDKDNFDTIVLGFNNCPFLNAEITRQLIESHVEFKSEYTFADGYPYGFAPEVIHAGTVKILYEISKTSQKSLGEKKVTKTSLFDLIKTDINSFEVETVMAPEDWRLLRLNFDTSKKENFLACKALFEKVNGDVQKNIIELSEIAASTPEVLKTVPGFYNIQISSKVSSDVIYAPYNKFAKEDDFNPECENLSKEKFNEIIEKIAEFSDTAVIGLSAWGEAFAHEDILWFISKILSHKGLSVFIETNGLYIDQDLCNSLKDIVENAELRSNGWEKIMIAVVVDAASQETYKKLHVNCVEEEKEKAVKSISLLREAIGNNVYPQFTRMNQNEDELEKFFRYWKETTSPSGGQLIIQKYSDFAGRLPMFKPADLSPIDRNPCWHLRRDMTILMNGDVPMCHQCGFKQIMGNVFLEPLEEIWNKNNSLLEKHMCKQYEGLCGNCDEYYVFCF